MYNVKSEMVQPFRQNICCGACNSILECKGSEVFDCSPPIYKYMYMCTKEGCRLYGELIVTSERFPKIVYKKVNYTWENNINE